MFTHVRLSGKIFIGTVLVFLFHIEFSVVFTSEPLGLQINYCSE